MVFPLVLSATGSRNFSSWVLQRLLVNIMQLSLTGTTVSAPQCPKKSSSKTTHNSTTHNELFVQKVIHYTILLCFIRICFSLIIIPIILTVSSATCSITTPAMPPGIKAWIMAYEALHSFDIAPAYFSVIPSGLMFPWAEMLSQLSSIPSKTFFCTDRTCLFSSFFIVVSLVHLHGQAVLFVWFLSYFIKTDFPPAFHHRKPMSVK